MTDIESLIEQMTLEEKAALCTGATAWTTTPVERLGIPPLTVSDGPHGLRFHKDIHSVTSSTHLATCFPTASCTACTWNTELLSEMGAALAEECIAQGVDVLLGPGVNMKRSPLGGRNFEYFSEDPYLAGEMAVALIQGVQSKGVGTSLKHFAANNQEFQRFSINAVVDKRALREIYLPAFETAVKKAKPWTVMCAYNKLNGVYGSENHALLVETLKNEWGFEGFVVSDWGAVHDRVAALQGGVDLEMPGPQGRRVNAVIGVVRDSSLDERILNESVRRILSIVSRAQKTPKGGAYDSDAHHALAQKVAAEGMVLLKNEGILPLNPGGKIAVIGRAAKQAHIQGGGSSHVHPTRVDVPFDELLTRTGQNKLAYAEGYPADDSFSQRMIDEAVQTAGTAEVALLFMALPAYKEAEGYDRKDMDLTRQQITLIQAVAKAQPRTVVVLNNGAPVAMSDWIDSVPAVLEAWMMGQAGSAALADILFGLANPSGKLAETFPLKLSDTPAYLNWPGDGGEVRYGEGIFIGYRYYDAREMPVLFPFGHGLSYTSFAYANPTVSSQIFDDVDGVTVSVDVTNTGRMAGKEIVQVYVSDRQAAFVRPPKELKGFAKVDLQPGETQTVSIHLDFRAFAYYHTGYHQWITEEGEFDILVGASSADIRCQQTVILRSTLQLHSLLDRNSTMRQWLDDPRGVAALQPVFELLVANADKIFSPDAHGEAASADLLSLILDMPLLSILTFEQGVLTMPGEEMLDGLLEQVHHGNQS